ncbi:MAG: bifunctional oligoribonuclease/PAP phosphatase NrnA [Clostridia bacterium]|nr:bifunctional oligoribonuclease/PAP phosphatase NrnA [Clostridia bacterium]
MQNRIYNVFKEAHKIALLPHENIDGDALASCLALKNFITAVGGDATVIAEGDIPSNLKFLGDDYVLYDKDISLPVFDVAVAVDCGSTDRFENRAHIYNGAKTKIVIDHHETNHGFGDLYIVSPESAATCEIIYTFFENFDVPVSEETAKFLYTGIVTDTGGFRFSNTTLKTFEIASNLIKTGINFSKICSNVFESKRIQQLKIEAAAIANVEFYHSGRTVITHVTQEMIDKTGATDGDMNNISSILRSIEGVSAAASLKDKNGVIKISMRSDESVNVAEICGLFGGGGHARAAGATSNLTAEQIKEKIIPEIGDSYERNS